MQTVKKLKDEIVLNRDMTDLMDVLKGIAVSEFWALAKKQGRFARFMNAFNGFFNILDFSLTGSPYVKGEGGLGILMITSSEGFMGGLNARVITKALWHEEADKAKLMIVGEQGSFYLRAMKRPFTAFPGIVSDERYEASVILRDHIVQEVKNGQFDRLIIYYPKPVSFMFQKVEELKILPCVDLLKGKENIKQEEIQDLIFESSSEKMIQYLIETWIVQKLYEVLEDSKLAEFSARTVHLEESLQTLRDQSGGIRYQYLRSWHELVNKGMRDVFSAQIARKKVKRSNQ